MASKLESRIYEVKRGDNGTRFEDHLQVNGESLDIASVVAVMRHKDGRILVEDDGEVLQSGDDQDTGEPNVGWLPEAGELEELGTHYFEWHVTLVGGRKVTMPRGGYYNVKVWDTLSEVQPISSSSSSD